MNKPELIASLATKSGLSKTDVTSVLDALTEVVTENVYQINDTVSIPGLGIFKQKTSSARTGRNPSTGEVVQVSAKTKVVFSASSSLKSK